MKALKFSHKGKDYYSLDLNQENTGIVDTYRHGLFVFRNKEVLQTEWYRKYGKNSIVKNAQVEVVEISWYRWASLTTAPRTREFIHGVSALRRIIRKDESGIVTLKKKVHINGSSAALLWGNWMRSEYYPLDKLPAFIQRHIDNGNFYR